MSFWSCLINHFVEYFLKGREISSVEGSKVTDLNHNISVYNIILKKMVKQDWMIPSSLIMLIIVATTNTEQCQIVLLNRCKAVYQEALRSSSKGEEGHCYRLQKMVTCLASNPNCGGELIEKFRYWMAQMAMMDKTLNICKDIRYENLKRVVQDTDVAKTHRQLDDVEFDSFEECAVSVHKQCVLYYVTLLMNDHKICGDAEKLNKCYDLKSKFSDCQAKIIKHYASMADTVAKRVIHLLNDYDRPLCVSQMELK